MHLRIGQVFDVSATQGAVYDRAARSVVMSALDGYNATVFAYGQTGSGKTYTLTGGETYGERGVIPRAIAQVFDEFRRREDHEFRCYVSYLEIYNESGFDLLDRCVGAVGGAGGCSPHAVPPARIRASRWRSGPRST